jgi:glycosyltransferase involved in cell wall biosynthesis
MKKKIFFVTPSLAIGGAERVMIWVANKLINDHEIQFIVIYDTEKNYLTELDKRIKIIYVNSNSVKKSIYKLYKLIYCHKNDVFFSGQMHMNLILLFIKYFKINKLKVVIREANSLDPFHLPTFKDKILYFFTLFFYKIADKIISLNHSTLEILSNKYTIKKSKIHLIQNPINISLIDSLSNEPLDQYFFSNYFIAIGRLEYQKNFVFLLNLFRYNTYNLIIIGDGKYHKKLNFLIKKYKISERVKLIGYKNNVFNYLSKSSGLLLPSFYEGFPNVMVQSLYLGIPIYVNETIKVGVDLIAETKLGYSLSLDNFSDWNNKLDNNEFDNIIKTNAKKYCIDNFSSQIIAQKYSRIFNEF